MYNPLYYLYFLTHISEISSNLKTVILIMIEPDHEKRLTVEQILSLPNVREVCCIHIQCHSNTL